MKRKVYPSGSVPQRNWRYIIIDGKYGNYHVLRSVPCSVDCSSNNAIQENINTILPSQEVWRGYSVNLHVKRSREQLKYKFIDRKTKYCEDWVCGTKGLLPKPRHVAFQPADKCVKIKISDIISFSALYEQSLNGNTKEELVTLRLTHKPTQSNYWHFELMLGGCYEERKTKKIVKALRSRIAVFIQPYSREQSMEIPKKYYRR